MKDTPENPLEATDTEVARAYAAERRANIRTFVRTNPDYYIAQFDKIGESAKFTPTFNAMAGLFGPIWFGARGLWSWALPFLILETLALVQITRGLFGDLAAEARDRIEDVISTNQADHTKAGHWGVPTCAFRGEPFFGQDRLDVLLWRLEQNGLAER